MNKVYNNYCIDLIDQIPKMPTLSLQPFLQTPPQRNIKPKCEICKQSFGVTLREHMCKRCYRTVCDNCSPYKVRSYRADLQHRLHRMCQICHKQSQILNRYVESNKLSWCEDSDMCKLWMKQLGYRNPARMSTRRSASNVLEYEAPISQIWASLNFSFRQFLGITIDRSKHTNKQVQLQISSCLSEILFTMNNHHIQAEQIIYILMFFLAHSSPPNAILLTKSIIQVLSCQEPSLESINYYLECLQVTDIQRYKIQSYLEGNLQLIANTATANYFTAEVSIEIICSLISKKFYQELQKGIAYIISERKDFIVKNSNKHQEIHMDILKNTQGLGSNYRKFTKQIEQMQNGGNKNFIKSQTASTIFKNQEKIQKLIRQNEQLKIKNKNQQDQIIRLKSDNNRLVQKQKEHVQQKQSKDKWSKVRKKSATMMNNQMVSMKRNKTKGKIVIGQSQFSESQFQKIDEGEDSVSQSYQSYWDEQSYSSLESSQMEDHQNNSSTNTKKIIDAFYSQFANKDLLDNVLTELSTKFKANKQIRTNSIRKSLMNRTPNRIRKKKPVKKYRKKQSFNICNTRQMSPSKPHKDNRKSTYSERLIKTNAQGHINTKHRQQMTVPAYQEMIYQKNEQISKLKKQLQITKCELKLMLQQQNENQNKFIKSKQTIDDKALKNMQQKYRKDMEEMREEYQDSLQESNKKVQQMKQMNRKLLIKMQQLSNMLMDKQEEQVNVSQKSLEELTKMYEQKTNHENQECAIF